jgi:hypothetical protein
VAVGADGMEEPSALDDAAAGGGRGGWDCKGMEDDAGEELANLWSRAFNAIALPKEYIGTTSNHIKNDFTVVVQLLHEHFLVVGCNCLIPDRNPTLV